MKELRLVRVLGGVGLVDQMEVGRRLEPSLQVLEELRSHSLGVI